jgi:hypothetical protein
VQSAVGTVFTINVSRTADSGAKSLRDAINSGNHVAAKFTSIVIRLSSGTYPLTRCGADDKNAVGDLDIFTSRPVTIIGTGSTVIRQTCAGERVIENRVQGRLVLQGVTVTGGTLQGTASAPAALGGGVSTGGDLELNNATITGNAATGFAGYYDSTTGALYPGGDARGGGVYVAGALTATSSTLSSNSANAGPGSASEGSASQGGAADGAGAYVLGAITLQGGAVSANHARGGGGVSHATYPSSGGAARGGGIAQDSASEAAVTITGTAFNGNVASGGSAGEGGSASSSSSGSADATGGALATTGPLTASRLSASDNQALPGASGGCSSCTRATARGGAVAALGKVAIADSSFTNNQLGRADAMLCSVTGNTNTCDPGCPYYISPYAWYTFCGGGSRPCDPSSSFPQCGAIEYVCTHNCTWLCQYNPVYTCGPAQTLAEGSAIWVISDASVSGTNVIGNAASPGQALFIGGHLDISASQLSDHESGIQTGSIAADSLTISNSGSAPARAPALSFSDAISVSRLVNSTVTGSVGGIVGAQLELEHATITSSADSAEALLEVQTLTTNRSLVVATGRPICSGAGLVQGSSYNWFTDASCGLAGTGDQQGAGDFRLGPLADNGGPVDTQSPGAGSVLIDAVPSDACPTPNDARGVTRPQGAACDIGAVEVRQ